MAIQYQTLYVVIAQKPRTSDKDAHMPSNCVFDVQALQVDASGKLASQPRSAASDVRPHVTPHLDEAAAAKIDNGAANFIHELLSYVPGCWMGHGENNQV